MKRPVCGAAAAFGLFLSGARVARRHPVTAREIRCFSAVNGLSGKGFVPVWMVMQFGSLGGVLVTGAATGAAGRPRLGRGLAAAGTLTWLGAKAAKPLVRRARPRLLIATATVRGQEQAGLGYPSGHAAVAGALAAVVAPEVAAAWRLPLWMTALGMGTARMYVGAHLPLDVAGGMALGFAIGTGSRAVMDRGSRRAGPAAPAAAAGGDRGAQYESARR